MKNNITNKIIVLGALASLGLCNGAYAGTPYEEFSDKAKCIFLREQANLAAGEINSGIYGSKKNLINALEGYLRECGSVNISNDEKGKINLKFLPLNK